MDFQYSVEERVAVLTLNRPELRNAFTFPMLDAWAESLRRAAADPAVRAVVITGAGGSFSSGVELKEIQTIPDTPIAHRRMLTRQVHQVARAVEELDKPYLAAVDGVAIGAGMDMALMADMRFVSPRTRFIEGYIKVGLVPGDGGCWYLPRIVGEAKALELLWTGDPVDGEEAVRIGLATRLYPADELRDNTLAFAAQLAAQPPVNVEMIKSTVRRTRDLDLRSSLDLIASHMAVAMATKDHREAMSAFRERRPGVFEDR